MNLKNIEKLASVIEKQTDTEYEEKEGFLYGFHSTSMRYASMHRWVE